MTPAGIISTIAGNGTAGFKGDGSAATAASLHDGVQVLQQVKIEALNITVVRGSGPEVLNWATGNGFFNGLFTRLVATNFRLVIMQGYEIARTWQIDQLPRSLTRYRRRSDGGEDRTIDLDAMRSMLGTASDQFADAKTILAFGKELGHIKAREDDRR